MLSQNEPDFSFLFTPFYGATPEGLHRIVRSAQGTKEGDSQGQRSASHNLIPSDQSLRTRTLHRQMRRSVRTCHRRFGRVTDNPNSPVSTLQLASLG
jgi:hypothetical protein